MRFLSRPSYTLLTADTEEITGTTYFGYCLNEISVSHNKDYYLLLKNVNIFCVNVKCTRRQLVVFVLTPKINTLNYMLIKV